MSSQELDTVGNDSPLGLEDVGDDDLVMPRLTILKTAQFQDSVTNEVFDSLDNVVVLGLVRQRVLWPATIGTDAAKPLCRSRDGELGQPQDGFPWKESGFTPDHNADVLTLSCEACPLKEWGSHPKQDQVPWCTEQRVIILYYEGGPALLTLQRSAMGAVRKYATGFKRNGLPTFTKFTTIKLQAQKRGTVEYAVPQFITGALTDVDDHDFYGDLYKRTRAFLHSQPTVRADDDNVAKAAVKERREPVAVVEDDDSEPF